MYASLILRYLVLNSMYGIIQLYTLIESLLLSPNYKERRDVLYRIVINRVDSFTLFIQLQSRLKFITGIEVSELSQFDL